MWAMVLPPTRAHERRNTTTSTRRRRLRWAILAMAILVLLFYAGGGWMFSNEIRSGALEVEAPGTPTYDVEVLAIDATTLTLSLSDTENDHVDGVGIRGIQWPDGAGWVGDVIAETDDTVERPYELYPGSGELDVGQQVDMHGYVTQADPATLGYAFEEISYTTPLGEMTAVHFPAGTDDWVILVHGKSAPLRETYRLVPALVDAGWHAMAIHYRNDDGHPADPSGYYRYGATEWKDVAEAVQYAIDHGAEDIALVGFSMGGGAVMSFALESTLAEEVDALVLDAAMLDFGATIDFRAEDRSLPLVGLPVPQSLTSVAKWMAGIRFDIDWGDLDYVARSDRLAIPALAFHGTEDESVPIEPARELARLWPDLVRLEEVEQAGHVLAWNVDPAAYESRLVEFLATHLEG